LRKEPKTTKCWFKVFLEDFGLGSKGYCTQNKNWIIQQIEGIDLAKTK
jgi:hypothetical protein